MTTPVAGLLDTSIFIASEQGRPLGPLPERVAVSVVTLGELQLGVNAAPDENIRALRGDTLKLARTADPVPVTESTMAAWARLIIDCRAAGVTRTVKLMDSLIAATSLDLGLPVVTQDADYDQLALTHPELRVIHV